MKFDKMNDTTWICNIDNITIFHIVKCRKSFLLKVFGKGRKPVRIFDKFDDAVKQAELDLTNI